jgi:membrane protease YdiL (CAAX protease family)
MKTRNQLLVLAIFVFVFAFLAFITATFFQEAQQAGLPAQVPSQTSDMPPWLLGLASAGIILVVYGLFGLAGFWLARKLNLRGIYKEGDGWREWAWMPLAIGLLVGVVMVAVDRLFVLGTGWDGFTHPVFPLSIIASATAGIGEEILFRGFVLGLWAYLLNLILRRWRKTDLALWIGNVIAALAFAASHLPALMLLYGFPSISAIPPIILGELFLLNGVLGLVAGARMFRAGLVAAIGIHFWADIVWHVIWPLVG